ncbi:MAG: RnfABCDGE type electron transport complex subunit D [bacterium]|nr:RnfABCDGE type electron transport complex subunit D [bacterium]
MIRIIDSYLDRITMYRLMLYYLLVLIGIALVFGFIGTLQYAPLTIFSSLVVLVSVCVLVNTFFSTILKVPTNLESAYITALILTFIMTPLASVDSLWIFGLVGFLAMASKYVLAINKKHLFNPVAISVVLLSMTTGVYADWWAGHISMLPFVVIGGLLIMRKTRKEYMLVSLFFTASVASSLFALFRSENILLALNTTLVSSAFCFLGFVMFTEPLTTPPTKKMQLIYGGIVGFLFPQQLQIGTLYLTPELSLVLGNIFSFLVSPKQRLVLYLKEKIQLAPDIAEFVFKPDRRVAFSPGQYMEWTLSHHHTDSRGSRRYFTLASSPTEDTLRLGVKLSQNGSSFKRALSAISEKVPVVASQLSGEFVLPDDKTRKMVFIAGGIGVTPFRSIVTYLLDTKETRQVVMLYANKLVSDIVYKDIFDRAEKELGIKTIYSLTDKDSVPKGWKGRVGRIDANVIGEEVPDWKDRYFYLSGPHPMVTGYEDVLRQMGLPKRQIKTDFFPGYA